MMDCNRLQMLPSLNELNKLPHPLIFPFFLWQPSCLLGLIHKVLLDAIMNSVNKQHQVYHFSSDTTYGDLEEKGIIYLETVEKKLLNFEVKMAFPISNNPQSAWINLPILDLKYDFTWQENEISDVQLVMRKVWDYFNTMEAMSQQYPKRVRLADQVPSTKASHPCETTPKL